MPDGLTNMVLFSADVVRLRSHHVTYLSIRLSPRRVCVCGKAPHPRQGWGAFLFPAFA